MSPLHGQLAITGLYTALLALLFVAGEIIAGKRDARGLDLTTRMRQRSEHVPFALLLMAAIELGGSPGPVLHGMGLLLLVARAAAPLAGIARAPRRRVEQAGVLLTIGVTCAAALWVLMRAVSGTQ